MVEQRKEARADSHLAFRDGLSLEDDVERGVTILPAFDGSLRHRVRLSNRGRRGDSPLASPRVGCIARAAEAACLGRQCQYIWRAWLHGGSGSVCLCPLNTGREPTKSGDLLSRGPSRLCPLPGNNF